MRLCGWGSPSLARLQEQSVKGSARTRTRTPPPPRRGICMHAHGSCSGTAGAEDAALLEGQSLRRALRTGAPRGLEGCCAADGPSSVFPFAAEPLEWPFARKAAITPPGPDCTDFACSKRLQALSSCTAGRNSTGKASPSPGKTWRWRQRDGCSAVRMTPGTWVVPGACDQSEGAQGRRVSGWRGQGAESGGQWATLTACQLVQE